MWGGTLHEKYNRTSNQLLSKLEQSHRGIAILHLTPIDPKTLPVSESNKQDTKK